MGREWELSFRLGMRPWIAVACSWLLQLQFSSFTQSVKVLSVTVCL
jgi:hypothetical protein